LIVALKFSKQALEEFERIQKRYPERRAALLPALWMAQKEFGYLPPEALGLCADLTGCSPAQVLEVAEFYTMYRKQPCGKNHLQVCRTLSCMLAGSEEIRAAIERKLGLKPGQMTPDGKFSFQEVECLGSCHTSPCLMVNDELHENLTPDKVEALIEKLRKT
jgi:NADH-quinone oxidoreductase subunit E